MFGFQIRGSTLHMACLSLLRNGLQVLMADEPEEAAEAAAGGRATAAAAAAATAAEMPQVAVAICETHAVCGCRLVTRVVRDEQAFVCCYRVGVRQQQLQAPSAQGSAMRGRACASHATPA
jgi:hypothetical protein